MNFIKNLHLLTDIVSQDDIEKMEHSARLHKQYSNITFKVVEANSKKVIFQAAQGKSSAGNYQTAKRLIEIVHETFDRFFPGRLVNVGPVPYRVPDPNQVSSDWIAGQLKKNKIRLKQVADETGIDYSQLAAVSSGDRPISQPMKALFWYYFLNKGQAKKPQK